MKHHICHTVTDSRLCQLGRTKSQSIGRRGVSGDATSQGEIFGSCLALSPSRCCAVTELSSLA